MMKVNDNLSILRSRFSFQPPSVNLPDFLKSFVPSSSYASHGKTVSVAQTAAAQPPTTITATTRNTQRAAANRLLELCTRCSDASGGDGIAHDHLAREVLSLAKQVPREDFESRLFDLLGESCIDCIVEILHDYEKFKCIGDKSLYEAVKSFDKDKAIHRATEGQVDLLQKFGFSEEYLEQERQLGLQKNRTSEETWRENLAPAGSREYHEARGLPPGTERKVELGYEEVYIPAPAKPRLPGDDELVQISSLEPWAQSAFEGTKRLNKIQSAVFDTAFNTYENMLICAPTGAGKTNIAMLTFLAHVRQSIQHGGEIDRSAIKAIYIAPMKALCQEVVDKFSERLKPMQLKVREFTGDMQLTRQEIIDSQLIVTTPEKWDVVTRKGGDGSLASMVSLIIIDEVHLLADERGAVLETLVARSHRQVEQSQKMVRLVALSATLPNYEDVADFLRVNRHKGLYFFGPEFRPVPLDQTFIGVTEKQRQKRADYMNRKAYEKMVQALDRGKQVMIFVHSRKETSKTVEAMRDLAGKGGTYHLLDNKYHELYSIWKRQVDKSRSAELQQLFEHGLGVHHAGMLRNDRTMTERLFECGLIKVLCCTATLAWGVNLPAHTVIIKGTEIYDPERGGFVDLGILDVLQIFGRAGRPQYDNCGHAILITAHECLGNYLRLIAHQAPIESSLIKALPDHLNAEVVSGTINNVREAIAWLSYTFLHIRLCKNPIIYGVAFEDSYHDPQMQIKRTELIKNAIQVLDQCTMIRYDPRSENIASTDMGRIASYYYIKYGTIEAFNTMLSAQLSDSESLHVMCSSAEFDQLKLRPEELAEMDKLKKHSYVRCRAPLEDTAGKVNVLLQGYMDQCKVTSFTLQSDMNYIAQNAGRIARALFEICLKRGWSTLSSHYLTLAKAIDQRMRPNQCALRQFNELPYEIIKKIEDAELDLDKLVDMQASEIGFMCRSQKFGPKIHDLLRRLPYLEVDAFVQPITRGVLRINLSVSCAFQWTDRYHGASEPFWIWVEDGENEFIYHSEQLLLSKKQAHEVHKLEFTIPIREPVPPQYYVRVISDRWVGCDSVIALSFQHLMLPYMFPSHTDLFDMHPVPRSALKNPKFERLYKYPFFNPIQSQVFYQLYHTDSSVLVGAPTGSGKTITCEFSILRLLANRPGKKVVYVAPLKALAKERLLDWREKLGIGLGLNVVELSGDVTPNLALLKSADIIITTPEKWDGITRGWQKREYVQLVELIIIDEIHLLGVDRGPVLEVIVSRMRYIASQTMNPIRFVGLSTALANPKDLADWLGIEKVGIFNFRPSVRPIPMTIHIQGFPGKHYCPRMATMNKPTFAAIMEHSPKKPVLVFVSSRRQTRLTALDLISYCATDDNPKKFLHMDESEIIAIATTMRDKALQDTLVFGIGIHHAGLDTMDRNQVEKLFCEGKIQVLVCTSTLAWGVNFPAHLVIVKGTEYYDGKTKRYVDFPVTDILQMIGRAGRPQFDDTGVACLLVHEPKKTFYKKFLHEPFPVESSLHHQLHNHINAEIATSAVCNLVDCVEYISWTYYFRRLLVNPSYYGLSDTSNEGIQRHLLELIKSTLIDLKENLCIESNEDFSEISLTILGFISSYYYLDYRTVCIFKNTLMSIGPDAPIESMVGLISSAIEFSELPVRHNEDLLNAELSEGLPWPVDEGTLDTSNTKTFLLLQAHIYRHPLPISDYINDTKSVLDQVPRVLNALIDISGDEGHLNNVLTLMKISQMIIQGLSHNSNELLQLPELSPDGVSLLNDCGCRSLRDIAMMPSEKLSSVCGKIMSSKCLGNFLNTVKEIPLFRLQLRTKLKDDLDSNWVSISSKPVVLKSGEVYILEVNIERTHGSPNAKTYSPKFHKPKIPSWWLVLGYAKYGELIALKRIEEIGHSRVSRLQFLSPEEDIDGTMLTLYLVPDSIMGLDVSYQILCTIER